MEDTRLVRPIRRQRGYTLIELMVGLAVVAITIAWAAPSYGNFLLAAAMTREVNQYLQGVYFARSEAIKRNEVVSLCPSRDGATCSPSTLWAAGWLIFVNLDRDSPAAVDSGEELLRAYPAWDSGQIKSNRTTLSFRAFGQSGVTATITFCDARGSSAARAVIVSQTGRPRVADKNSSGGALNCS